MHTERRTFDRTLFFFCSTIVYSIARRPRDATRRDASPIRSNIHMTSSDRSESSSSFAKNRTKNGNGNGNGNGKTNGKAGTDASVVDVLRNVFTTPKTAIGLAVFALGFAISHRFSVHFERDEFPIWQRVFHGTVWFVLYFLAITLYALFASFF